MKKRITIIGTGKVGSSFAFELKDKGYEVNFLISRDSNALADLSAKIHPISSSEIIQAEYINGSEVIFICVQDKYIKEVINEIIRSECNTAGKYFIHTSGAESTKLFPEEQFARDNVASLHPIQTFNRISSQNNHLLENIYFGLEGGESAKLFTKRLIQDLGSSYIEIPKDKKYLYHSACVVSSNFLITLLNISSEIMGSIGIDKSKTFEIFKPIIDKTLNNIANDGLTNSLTGPFERNDIATITGHLDSMEKDLPSLIPFYTLLGMETVKVAFKKESLSLQGVISILDLMNEYIINESKKTGKPIN